MLLEEEESRDLWDILREIYETRAGQKGGIMGTKHFRIVCAECGGDDVVISTVHSDWEGESIKRLRCKSCGAKEDL